jgi:hypothetical protein
MAKQGWVVFSAILVSVALGCESPFEPRGDGERVPIGQVIEHEVIGDSADWYSFEASPKVLYVVFLEALRGSAYLVVSDSSHQSQFAYVVASTGGPKLLENASGTVGTQDGGVYRLRVTGVLQNTTARYRFMVYAIDQAPELVPSNFTLGDTVAGETIQPMVDLDSFVVQGDAGQDIVAVAEAQGPAGSGSISLIVIDPVANSFLGYLVTSAGTSTPVTTGRVRLPGSHAYSFHLGSVVSNLSPRYRGPYRFWSYAINRAPEHRPATLPVGAVVFGETVDRAGDVDEFTFPGTAGASFNAFVQASHGVQLEIVADSGPALTAAVSDPVDTALFGVATGRVTLTRSGTYRVRVSGTTPTDIADTGAYRFLLYPIDPRPEHVSANIAAGDTVLGESIDVSGDVDEFVVPGAPGDQDNVFFQALTGSPVAPLRLEVVNDSGRVLNSVLSSAADTGLTHQFTGRFVIPPTGSLRLRVTGESSTAARDTGSYRLSLYPVNRKPEHGSDTLVFGDSVLAERIELPGDVDEFHVTIPDSSGANLVIQLDSAATGVPLVVSLLDFTGHAGPQLFAWNPGEFVQTSTFPIGPGTYTLQVNAYDGQSAVVGGYRMWLYKFRFAPEVAPDTVAIGDTIVGEALDPPGDVDQFMFYGRRGEHINVALQGLAVPGNGGFLAMLSAPGQPPSSFVGSPMLADSLGAYQSNRVDLAQTGWYELRISGGSSPTLLSERGPYRFAVTRWSTAPEHVGAALAPGDSVTGEAIDYPWDWDEFTITGTPGQILAIVSRTTSGSGSAYLLAFDSTPGDTLAWAGVPATDGSSGRFVLPASGEAELAVYSSTFVGGYRFTVVPVNPGPENVPAAFALGDTVRGEAIFPATDVDEFTSSGTPGATLAPWWRLTANPVPAGGLMSLQIVDPATGTVVIGSNVAIFASTPDFFSPGQFTVPASGNYVVRVRAYYDNDMTTAPYEFYVAPTP